MLAKRIIPCLDVTDGRVVKGVNFVDLIDAGDPVECAFAYNAQEADELVFLDITATSDNRRTMVDVVSRTAEHCFIPLTVGGGIRTVDNMREMLHAGADKVAVNTAAVKRPRLLAEIAERFGSQCAILALDAARDASGHGWEVVIRSGRERTGRDAIRWASEAVQAGAGEILLTSWDRDGTRGGYDCELVRAVCLAVNVPVIASGGAARASDLAEALDAGASAVLAASLFHDGDFTVAEIKDQLAQRGVEVRK